MSTCVNLNSKDFKDCCNRLNVSAATLEPIVHEYINIEGNEDSFPSDVYIEEKIHGRSTAVISDKQVQLWEDRYSQPKTFDYAEEATSYYNEIRKFFPKEFIGFKETLDGKYEIRVAEPFNSSELEDIKKKAIANGTFMKAPNGQPTNLTEQQWLQVRTKAFKRWFGDWENNPENASQVVDENGEPLVVYHGGSLVREFDTSGKKGRGSGIKKGDIGVYFTSREKSAKNYEEIHRYKNEDGVFDIIAELKAKGLSDEEIDKEWNSSMLSIRSGTRAFFLNIKNPSKKHYEGNSKDGYKETNENVVESNDGQIITRSDTKEVEYVAKNPNQIKSATDNIGTYSLEDDNIYYQTTTDESTYVEFLTSDNLNEFGLELDKEYTINDILKILPEISLPISKDVIVELLKAASKVGIKYVFEVGPDNKTFGMSEGMKIHLYSSPSNPYFIHSLIHETIHSFLAYAIDNPNSDLLTKKQKKAIKELQEIFEFVKNEDIDNRFGALNDIQEFVAELANPNVYNKLKEFKKPYKNENVFTKLWRALLDFLGLSKTLNTEVENIIRSFLVSPSVYKELQFRMISSQNKETNKQVSEDFEAKVKEIQEALGCDEKTARGLAEMYDDNSTEEELKSNEEQLAELDAIFKDSLNVGEQIEALINSNDITKSEIITIAYDIAYTISDLITTWHENPQELVSKFGKSTEDIDKIKSMTRAELVEYIGVSNLFDYVKEFYFGSVTDPNLMDKADVLYENFDAVIKFGTSAFASVEDFALTYSEVGYTVSDQSTDDSDSELAKDVEEAGESGDKQEHWQIDSRTIDNFLSMSQIVKRELVRLYLVDESIGENGLPTTKVRTNAFGMKKRVDPKDATNSILRWTRGALTLPQMIARLKEKQNSDPWVKPLITKLEDSIGKYTDFQSQFFTVFCKHFQEYYIVTEEKQKDGTTINKVIPVNINPALKEVMDSIKLLYELHAHPLFDAKGVKKDKLEELTKYVELLGTLVNESTPNIERIKNGIVKISELLGFKVDDVTVELAINPTMLQDTMTNLRYIVKNLTAGAKQENYNPFEFKKGGNSIGTNLRNFLKPLTDRMEDVAIGAFYDSGKMYQSEVLPSWLSKTMDKFLTLDGKEYEEFLMKEYGQYEWFRNTKETDIKKGWRNPWLQRLAKATLEERKEMFGHHVQLNYLGHNYMRNMSSPEYVLATLGEFFNDTTSDKESIGYSYYKIPMMSNKPSLEFIKFIRYKGLNYEDSIVNGLFNVYLQELMRIQTVLKRGYKKGDPQFIVPFDARGKHFLFLDYLDVYLNGSEKNSELGVLLNKKVKGEELPDVVIDGDKMSGEDGLKLLVKRAIKDQMKAKADSIIADYKAKGIFEAAKKVGGVGKSDAEVEANLRNFIWNDTFAAINILQMTITDLAYYKNTEDVQKRLAQIHAPGMKGNVNATDYDGNPVCDGYMRAVFLADYEGDAVIQNIVENLEIVFDRKIATAKTDTERDYWESTKEAIIEGIKTSVNVADAQAYNCPTSYRKKALMFGKWSKEFEKAYEKLKKGEATIHDVEIAFQPLKPFVYTSTTKESGVEGAPIQKMKVGMQFKNSEYLLILADAILQGEDTGRPNILRAIFEVMEESAEKDPTKGIDTFMFASAVKAGLHGRIDLKDFLEGGDAKEYIKKKIEDATSADGYNATYVHTYPAEDYIIQQEVPKHFLDHSQAHGSQERYIIPSDLQETYDDGTPVYYEYRDGDKIVRKTAKEFKEEYESTIAENIQDSIDNLFEELGLNFTGPDAPRLRNIALSKILQKEILSSPRYGVDLYIACSVNSDGEFKVPLGDPIQSKRVEQLINSIIKNRINKQKIAGGPVVQVSNFGTSKRLNIRFKDKEGNILPTFTEWSNKEENKGKTIDDFKKELKEKQSGVAHYECYAPAYMQEIFECFMDEKGNIDVKAMEKANPELLEMIGYRI